MYGEECDFPTYNTNANIQEEEDSEVSLFAEIDVSNISGKDEPWPLDMLMKRFSSWTKIVRITAWVNRFISQLRRQDVSFSKAMLPDEIKKSEHTLIKHAQRQSGLLRNDKPHERIVKLKPFVDEQGILRVGGRIENASSFNYDEKHPIILPKDKRSSISQHILTDLHIKNAHSGAKHTLSLARRRFWPIAGLAQCKRMCHRCAHCIEETARMATQIMAPLPEVRLKCRYPFEHCGCDCFGPLYVKVGRARVK